MMPVDGSPIVRDGKLLILAYDHGLEHGPIDFTDVPESADPDHVFDAATHDAVTSIAVGKGIAEAYYPSYEGDVSLMAKLNGTSNLWRGEPDSAVNWTVENAHEVGADAVGFTVYGGSNNEIEMAEEFRDAQESARGHEMPVVMWSYPRGQGLRNDTTDDVIAYAARLGLELGADVAKVKYPGSQAGMEHAVRMAGKTKLVMSGGSKQSDEEFLANVKAVIDAGGAGLAVGRNIWQRENPERILDALEMIIFEESSVTKALAAARGTAPSKAE
jgi:class I fructose-bisphosphate aldolase